LLVLVTGGTGYLGSHSVAALARAGHRIRVLARSAEKVPAALGPLGVSGMETAIGDVTDPAAVERALTGCDAVVHAASVFSLDVRRAGEMNAVNVRGTEVVLGTADRLGLDPIVHVSSEVALLPPAAGEVLTPNSPVGRLALLPVQGRFRAGGPEVPGAGRAGGERHAGRAVGAARPAPG
jgi:dihydroflavonol-4-reductase